MSEDWDFYRLLIDNKPASIMVDLGIRSTVPIKTHGLMGYVRLKMNNPRPDGLSSQEEFDKLCEIGDAIEKSVALKNGIHLYVGRNTSDKNRDFYFYTSNLKSLHSALERVANQFPNYQFTMGGRDDQKWSTYLEFLHPNPSQKQQMMDNRVCEALREAGDDLSIEREIDHRVYFSNKTNLSLYKNCIEANDFIKIHSGKTKPMFGELFLDFKHVGAPAEISNVVYYLFNKAEELGGKYDGWGCSVEKTTSN